MASASETLPADGSFLGSYLPYLLNRVTREMLRGVDDQFSQRDLTMTKWRILAVLSDRGTCRFGELVELTSIEPATLSRFVGSLDESGLIRRRRPKSDARTVLITLTEQGGAAFRDTLAWACDVERRLTRTLSTDEIELLKKMLTQMFANLKTITLPDLAQDAASPTAEPTPGHDDHIV